jgi:C-terminal processing protease CtpA/Prc
VLSLVGNLLLGPAGSIVELQLRWRDGAITRHAMRRPDAGASRPAPLFAHLDPKSRAPRAATVADAAWIELRTFVDAGEVDAAEKALAQPAAQRGVVLDLRRNQGGQILLAQRLVERFLPTPIDLVFVPKEPVTTWLGLFDVELFVVDEWRPQPPTLQAPLVVLTSALTGSSAEHAARVLQRHCGAIVVGERTAGAEAVVRSSVAPDGSVLRFGSTRVVDRTGVGLQREGVAPDVAVRLTVADVEAHGPERAVAEWEERLAEAAAAALARRRGR